MKHEEKVRIIHPDLPGRELIVSESGAVAREGSGWVRADAEDAPVVDDDDLEDDEDLEYLDEDEYIEE